MIGVCVRLQRISWHWQVLVNESFQCKLHHCRLRFWAQKTMKIQQSHRYPEACFYVFSMASARLVLVFMFKGFHGTGTYMTESFLCKLHHCCFQGAENSKKIQHKRVKSPVELEKSEIQHNGVKSPQYWPYFIHLILQPTGLTW